MKDITSVNLGSISGFVELKSKEDLNKTKEYGKNRLPKNNNRLLFGGLDKYASSANRWEENWTCRRLRLSELIQKIDHNGIVPQQRQPAAGVDLVDGDPQSGGFPFSLPSIQQKNTTFAALLRYGQFGPCLVIREFDYDF